MRIGYDIDSVDDMADLRDTLRWAAEQRFNMNRRNTNQIAFVWSAIAALFGAGVTIIGDWLIGSRR